MNEKFELNGYPIKIQSTIEMEESNSKIPIYSGSYLLKNETLELTLEGKFFFKWSPSLNVYFQGTTKGNTRKLFEIFNSDKDFSILIDGLEVGKGFITAIQDNIEGVFRSKAVFGDRTIAVQKISFCVPNLRDFNGDQVVEKINNNISYSNSRLHFENDDFNIILDKKRNYSDLNKELKHKGGYLIQYNGELERIDKKSISHKDSLEIFQCFSTFLSFLNGRKTSAIFRVGIFDDRKLWKDFTNYTVEPYKHNHSWPDHSSTTGINEVWKNFSDLWKDHKDFIRSSIHWYLQSCSSSSYVETAIIMAQTALELIYNWWIIECKKMIIGKDSENLSASNKIRLLISQLNITSDVPIDLKNLDEYVRSEITVNDGPEAIVQIRNAIVHSQMEKRKKLNSLSFEVRYEALRLSIWYIEISLLKILGFEGKYNNQTSQVYDEYVPWSEQNASR